LAGKNTIDQYDSYQTIIRSIGSPSDNLIQFVITTYNDPDDESSMRPRCAREAFAKMHDEAGLLNEDLVTFDAYIEGTFKFIFRVLTVEFILTDSAFIAVKLSSLLEFSQSNPDIFSGPDREEINWRELYQPHLTNAII
jgi:hypothetical protein